jgi:hypothetical protein
MFSQEAVTRILHLREQVAVVAEKQGSKWDTAERYYDNGGFVCMATEVQAVLVCEQPSSTSAADSLLIAEDTENPNGRRDTVVFVAAAQQPKGASADTTPTASPMIDERADAAPRPPVALSSPVKVESQTEIVPDPFRDAPPPGDLLVVPSDPKEQDTQVVAEAESTAPAERGAIDVLPLPLAPPVSQQTAEFGVFPDDSRAPEQGTAGTAQNSSDNAGYGLPDAYAIPAGPATRYVDPLELVRQRAIERAENRQRRIEVRKWMGYDPLRPAVTAVPYTSAPETRPVLVVVPFVIRSED